MKTLFNLLVMLTMMMNLSISSNSYAKGIRNDFDLHLNFPNYEKYELSANNFIYGIDTEGYKQALKIHATYQSLGRMAVQLEDEIDKLEAKIVSYDLELNACRYVLQEVNLDRGAMYDVFEKERKISENKIENQRKKFILFGVTGGTVALVGGFLLGWFVGH